MLKALANRYFPSSRASRLRYDGAPSAGAFSFANGLPIAASPEYRTLENPPARVAIADDFPKVLDRYEPKECLKALDRQLKKRGASLGDVGHITIAYPHKTLKDKDYHNGAHSIAKTLAADLEKHCPHVNWILADAIHETVKLGRSEDQTSLHALKGRQIYAVDPDVQHVRLPFIETSFRPDREFFIVTDGCIEQGTTLANLISYITHNGGDVLAAMARNEVWLQQQESESKIKLQDPSMQKGRIPDLARAFHASARKDRLAVTPDRCVEIIEAGLQACGNSLHALTDGECTRIINSLDGNYYHDWSFRDAVRDLGQSAALRKKRHPALAVPMAA